MPAADGAGILNWVLLSCDEVDDDGDTIPFWLEPKGSEIKRGRTLV